MGRALTYRVEGGCMRRRCEQLAGHGVLARLLCVSTAGRAGSSPISGNMPACTSPSAKEVTLQ